MATEAELKEKYDHEMKAMENYMKEYPKDTDYGERYVVGFSDGYKVASKQVGCNVALWHRNKKENPLDYCYETTWNHDEKMVKDFKKMAKAVKKFMQKYGNPHATIVARLDGVEFSYGEMAEPFDVID